MSDFVETSYQFLDNVVLSNAKSSGKTMDDICEKESKRRVYSPSYVVQCIHPQWTEENSTHICMDCGMMIEKELSYEKEWRYYGLRDTKHQSDPNRCNLRKVEDKSIFRDVEKLGFSDKIISNANMIYEQVTQNRIFRGNTRRGIIFACIFHAHKLIDNPQSCDSLVEIFQIHRKTALKGLKYVNLNLSREKFPTGFQIDTPHLIREIMLKFNASESKIREVIQIFQVIQNRSSLLNRSRPQSVACGVVRYYILEHNPEISTEYFRSKVRLSELTINKIVKEIYRILES